MKYTIIYIPGLGDTKLDNRRRMLSLWSLRKTNVLICSMQWSADEPWARKLQRLTTLIEKESTEGQKIVLLGESAGASAAMNAFIAQQDNVAAVVLLCGKFQHPETISRQLLARNPALLEAVTTSHNFVTALTDEQKTKILNLHPLFDPVVPVSGTIISGVKDTRMPIVGHATSIVFANIFWMWRIVRFAKKLK